MLRMSGRRDGRRFILLGLERGNIERLQQDKPIRVDATELGFDGDIWIVFGKDADEIAARVAPGMTPEDRR